MPKSKETTSEFYNRIVNDHPGVFRCDKSVLFCLMCDKEVTAKQMSQVNQHLKAKSHTDAVERKKGGTNIKQTLLTTLSEETDRNRSASQFSMDLARCFLNANIPLHKIAHPSVKEFIEKHTKYASPSETTLRTKCLPVLYDECVQKMKQIAADNFIWVSLDESTDCEQRFVGNFVFGVLGVEGERGKSYLFASKVLEATNGTTIATFFDESINELSK